MRVGWMRGAVRTLDRSAIPESRGIPWQQGNLSGAEFGRSTECETMVEVIDPVDEQFHEGKAGTSWAIRWLLGAVAIWPLLAGLVVVVVEVVHEKSGYALPLAISVWVAWLYFVFDAAFAGRVPRAKVRLWVVTLLLGHVFAMRGSVNWCVNGFRRRPLDCRC